MRVGVPRESASGEHRVALAPDAVQRLVKAGAQVTVERGAGLHAFFPDDVYAAAGATLVDGPGAAFDADVVTKVRRPSLDEADRMRADAVLVALLQPAAGADLFPRLAERRVTALALELVPRITRAQSMDVLSSQATVAGYKGVLLGATALGRLLPMMTTAAGSLTPAKAFVIGAGVAGLQAIATARRLGAVVSAFDVRPAAREQVMSLGASFVASELVTAGAEAAGGYARAQTADEQTRTQETIAAHARDMDLVITTAQVPGKPAPRLITEAAVRGMKSGAVIVDLAADSGGNCELSRPGETVAVDGVAILAPLNVPATVPYHASQMFSKNVLTLLQHLMTKEGALRLDPEDEIVKAMLVTHGGNVVRR
jgi:NAD(P) transhydrogenase subunit alpha